MEVKLELINPQVKEVTIGIKQLRNIKIYPLSVRDQISLSEIIVSGIKDFYGGGEDKSEAAVAAWLVDMIEKNMDKIIKFVAIEEADDCDIFDELTNDQLVAVVDTIYEVNYGSVSKKVKDLLKKIKEQFLSRRSSVKSSETVPNTDLKISSENPIGTEE